MQPSTGDGKIRVNPVTIILVGLIFLGIGISVVGATSTSFQQAQQNGGWLYCYKSSYYGVPLTCSAQIPGGSWDTNGEIKVLSTTCDCFQSCFSSYTLSGTFSEASVNYVGGSSSWADYSTAYATLYDTNMNGLFSWTMHTGFGASGGEGRGFWSVKIGNDLIARVYYNGTEIVAARSPTNLTTYPRYFTLSSGEYWCTSSSSHYDDVCIGIGCAADAVVGTLPDYYYIKKDLLNPLDSGLYRNDTNVNAGSFYVDYGISGVSNTSAKHFDLVSETTGVSYEQCTTYTTSSYLPNGGMTYNNYPTFSVSSLAGSGAPYGQYAIKITDSSGPIVITREGDPFWYIAGGASITWDRHEYVAGMVPVITWDISSGYYLTDQFDYILHVMKADGTQMFVHTVFAQSGTITLDDTSAYDAGDYWVYMNAKKKSDSSDNIMAYDFASFVRDVQVDGYTIDAYNEAFLPGVAIGFNSSSVWVNTTSDGAAHYNVSGLAVTTIPVYAHIIGYDLRQFDFKPPGYGFYLLNISMLPTSIPTNTAINGLTVVDWNSNAIPTATVHIWNGTWSDTITGTGYGYYLFDNLAQSETYHVNATKTGYVDSPDYTVTTGGANTHTVQMVLLAPLYTLTVNVIDAETGSPVSGTTQITVTSSTYSTLNASTTTGTYAFTVPMGVYTGVAQNPGYYAGSQTSIVAGDKTMTITLTRSAQEAAPATRFLTPPHSVRFLCIDIFGNPISGMNVTATGVTTTLPAWSWLTSIFGINTNETPMQNTTMSGLTDSAGGITFLMLEIINYQVTFTDANRSINEVRNYYPKEDQYAEVFWPQAPAYSGTQLQYILYNTTGANNVTLGLLYSDSLGHTTDLSFYVEDYNTKQILYQNITSGPVSAANPTYTVPITKGALYVWGFNATVSDYKRPVHLDNYIRFAGQKRLIDLGIGENDMTDQLYNWFAVGLIVSFGAIFGKYTLKYGMPLTALWGAFWWIAGWLMAPGLLVAMAACIGVFAALRSGQEESGL